MLVEVFSSQTPRQHLDRTKKPFPIVDPPLHCLTPPMKSCLGPPHLNLFHLPLVPSLTNSLTHPNFSSSTFTPPNYHRLDHFYNHSTLSLLTMVQVHQLATPHSPTPTANSGDQTMEPKSSADATVNPKQDTQHSSAFTHLAEMLTVAMDWPKNAQNFQQQIDQLTKEKDLLVKENDRLVLGHHQLEEKNNQHTEGNKQLAKENGQLKEQLATVNEQPNTPETQKLIDRLTIENGQLKEAREAAIEQFKAQPIVQGMINKLVEEKKN